jgi:hypothetical protein
MDEKTKATLTNMDTWKRGLFMVLFIIISGVAKLIVTLVAVFQFITLLFKGEANEEMVAFGQNLSTYLYQITLFLTFKTGEMPFPFTAFPDGAPESQLNKDDEGDEGDEEIIVTAEATTKTHEETATATNQDIKDETRAAKDTKDDPIIS